MPEVRLVIPRVITQSRTISYFASPNRACFLFGIGALSARAIEIIWVTYHAHRNSIEVSTWRGAEYTEIRVQKMGSRRPWPGEVPLEEWFLGSTKYFQKFSIINASLPHHLGSFA